MSTQFNTGSFDSGVFGDYVGRVPAIKRSELIARRVYTGNSEIRSLFRGAGSAAYAKVPLFGAVSGAAQNYDGSVDITPAQTPSYEFGAVVIGRAKAWSERDFSSDITGADYMDNVARQIAEYFEEVDETTLLKILSGIFSLRALATGESESADAKRVAKSAFISSHTLDITSETDSAVGATSLNSAIQRACGSGKGRFAVVLLHSAVATNLENLALMDYLSYTDKNGITRDLAIGSWNGRSVIVSDKLPTSTSGNNTVYTSYILGEGSFIYEDIGARVPYEMQRDPAESGGCDILYCRQRKVIHPVGFDYVKASQASLSPTDAELASAVNWELAYDSAGNVIDDKLIPIARIISLG